MNKTNNEKSRCSEDSIDRSDDRLSSEDKSKSGSDFIRDDGPLIVEKSEVPIFYLSEESLDMFPIDNKEV